MKKFFDKPFFFIIFSLYPVLFFSSHNIDELLSIQILGPALIASTLALIIFFCLNIFIKNIQIAAIAVSVAFLAIRPFASERFFFDSLPLFDQSYNDKFYIFLFLTILIVAALFLKKMKIEYKKLNILLNFIALILVAMPLFTISMREALRLIRPVKINNLIIDSSTGGVNATNQTDIYYIIVDRYASSRSLKKFYNFDNSKFINFSKNKGFYIAEDSVANYPFTIPSLASSLNMSYMDTLLPNIDKNLSDDIPLINLIDDSAVVRTLKNYGYSFIHVGSSWQHTSKNPNADKNYIFESKNKKEIQKILSSLDYNPNNPLATFLKKTFSSDGKSILRGWNDDWNSRIDHWIKLSTIPDEKGPKFVFIHSLLTHPPYMFQAGGLIPNADKNITDPYINQLVFANEVLENLIDTLIRSSKNPPIIILQSDEGPYPALFEKDQANFKWDETDDDRIRKKSWILNAYYLPGLDTKILHSNISPVNTFRVIFSQYFGLDLPLLEDRNYMPYNATYFYNNFETTSIVK